MNKNYQEISAKLTHSMVEAGMIPPPAIEDSGSKIIRFCPDGGNNLNGWYCMHINNDGSAWWTFGDWKTGHTESGKYLPDGMELTPTQQKEWDLQIRAIKQQLEHDQQEKQAAAKIKAVAIWDKASVAQPEHPYIKIKRIEPTGIRQLNNTLVIPIYEDTKGSMTSLQFIEESGQKRFLPGGRIAGCFNIIGDPVSSRIIYIAEGFATGATIHEATGKAVVVAFNAGNLEAVCARFKDEFPDKNIVVAADNDLETERKTGKNKGKDTAINIYNKLGIKYCLCPVNSDFNDLFNKYQDKSEGLVAVADSLNNTKDTSTYSKWVDELNKKYAVVWIGNKCALLKEDFDENGNLADVEFVNDIDLKKFYANRTIPNPDHPKRETCVANYWLKSPSRRQYNKVVFEPGATVPPDHYNLWSGLAVEPVKGDWSLFRDHIYHIITNSKDDEFHWVMSWMARLVQNPGGERPGTAIVLQGSKGSGKGIFSEIFGNLFGSHYIQIAQQSQLLGKHNSHLKNKVLVFVDEGFWAGDRQADGVIKNLITEKMMIIEPKGIDAFAIKNHVNMIIASNNDRVVPATHKERRFYVTHVSNARIQDIQYFKAIKHQMRNGGLQAMLYDLMRWEYTAEDLRHAPKTQALLEQAEYSMSSLQKFWYDRLKDGLLRSNHTNWTGEVATADLYEDYINYAERLNDRYPKDSALFGKELRILCKDAYRYKPGKVHDRKYNYKFPSLEDCRFLFAEFMGMDNLINWDE